VPIFAKVPLPTEWAALSEDGHEARRNGVRLCPIFAKMPMHTEWAALSENGHEAGMKEHYFCIFVFGEGSLLLALGVTRGTRIHANRHESRAYTRLLFRLIAGSRGTLTPSQSARAKMFER